MNKFKGLFLTICLILSSVFFMSATAPMSNPVPVKTQITAEQATQISEYLKEASEKTVLAEKSTQKKSFFGKITSKIGSKFSEAKAKYKLIRAIKTDSRLLKIGLIILAIGALLWVLTYVIATSSTTGFGLLSSLYLFSWFVITTGLVIAIIGVVKSMFRNYL